MASTLLVLTDETGPSTWAARQAASLGDDLGLVLTAIEFAHEKVSGGRIEEVRDYAGTRFNTFDEPIFVGAAIAQLAGHAEAVVVDSLDDWAARLDRRFADNRVELDAEISSLLSVMRARMSVLLLVARRSVERPPAIAALCARLLAMVGAAAETIVEVERGQATVRKGALPS